MSLMLSIKRFFLYAFFPLFFLCIIAFVYLPVHASEKLFPEINISMEFRETDISTILRAITKETGKNILMGDGVKGTMTLSFNNTSINNAFETILQSTGLFYNVKGNIIQIYAVKEKKDRDKDLIEAAKMERDKHEELSPLISKAINLKYSINPRGSISGELPEESGKIRDLEELAKALEKKLSGREGANIAIINRTNTLLITDIASNVKKIAALIQELDQPLYQVTIESKITEIGTLALNELGVAWGGRLSRGSFEATGAGGLEELESTRNRGYDSTGVIDGLSTETMPQAGNIGLSGENLAVNLPAAVGAGKGGAIGFMIGSIGKDVLDIQLSALESEGKMKTLSNPRIITQDNQRAYIRSGYQIPYRNYEETALGRGEYTVEFKTAAIELEVTPHIIDQEIFLDIVVGNSSPDWSRAIGENPPIITRSLTTKVRVKNGETVVIGGLVKEYSNNGEEVVPLLHKIPLLGWLFKKKTNSNDKSELLIFITPRIIKPNGEPLALGNCEYELQN